MILNRKLNKNNITPDVGRLAREMTNKSQIAIVINKFLKLSPITWVPFGLNNLFYLPLLLKKDFAVGIKILCELEILKNKKKEHILHNQFVDMAIALHNRRVLSYFFKLSEKYRFQPSIITYNLESCITLLSYIKNIPDNLVIYTSLSVKNDDKSKSYVLRFCKSSFLKIVSI